MENNYCALLNLIFLLKTDIWFRIFCDVFFNDITLAFI